MYLMLKYAQTELGYDSYGIITMTVGKLCLPSTILRNKSPVASFTQYSSDSAITELA